MRSTGSNALRRERFTPQKGQRMITIVGYRKVGSCIVYNDDDDDRQFYYLRARRGS